MDMSIAQKKKRKQRGSLSGAVTAGVTISLIAPALSYLGIMIMTRTGIWWLPLIVGYFVILGIPFTYSINRRERYTYHMQIGHEMYYKENPSALKSALRKARKAGIPDDVRRIAAYYRSRTDIIPKFSDIKEAKRRRNAAFLYTGAVITAVLGIFLIWRAFPIPQGLFDQKIRKADYTSVFLLAGGLLSLISAVGLFLRKKVRPVRYAAAIMLALCVWSAFLAYTLRKRPTYTDSLIHAACLVTFALAALVAPEIAGDIRTAEQVHNDSKELRIGLYELGYLQEEDLQQ